MPTWNDVLRPRPEEIWRELRQMRHRPPGRASSGDRRATFTSSLEQAEQMFRAAATVGYATRPLLLFYGISQAGRAVAAAAVKAGPNDYMLGTHGIATTDMTAANLTQVIERAKGSGAFGQVAEILGSPSLPEPTPLGDIWATIPEAIEHPLASIAYPILTLDPLDLDPYVISNRPRGIVRGIPAGTVTEEDPEGSLRAFLSCYPGIGEYELVPLPDGRPNIQTDNDGRAWAMVVWEESDSSVIARRERYISVTQPVYGAGHRPLIFPCVGGNQAVLHPLLAWWAVLHALSNLARYQPVRWSEHIAVDTSKVAVAIEVLLDEAVTVVPDLIWHAIREVV
ncbi:YaaC family protein [Kitasatospora sp. NPDC057965]|uniref:YaaC family protein n=1 Tax=Kitasatospora sp. NPDC057965 TaxID=3346291 RepID=UPI0036DECE8A